MRVVHKFPLPKELTMGDAVRLQMPSGAHVVRFALQDDVPTLWAEVDTERSLRPRRFQIFGTGQPLARGAQYVGTWDFPPFVWHIYEVPDA